MRCLEDHQEVSKEFGEANKFEQYVFDNQLATAKAIIGRAIDLRIPVFQGIEIPQSKMQ